MTGFIPSSLVSLATVGLEEVYSDSIAQFMEEASVDLDEAMTRDGLPFEPKPETPLDLSKVTLDDFEEIAF